MPIHHPEDRPLSPTPHCTARAVSLQEVSFSYPDGHQALTSINLEIQRGDKVALVGPNGAGKSTLLLQLNGVYHGEGKIDIMGIPLRKDTLPLIRARIGLVFQNPDDQLFSPTVFEDVAFGPLHMGLPGDIVKERVKTALDEVGMRTYSDRQSYHLSLGEKKRVSIATVLAMKPDILVFDEPTSGLDPRARRSLINFLTELELTTLVSTHDMRLVEEVFPRIIIMDQGKIVADGLTAQLLNNPRLLSAHGLEQP